MRFISTTQTPALGYVVLQSIFIGVIFVLGFKKDIRPKRSQFFLSLLLAGCFQINVTPISENDQYRYFWEGKVAANLKNPYKLAPSSSELDFINFQERHLIAYNKLTSIYPPLSIAFWASFSSMNYKSMLIINQVCFLILYIFFCWIILSYKEDYFFISISSLTFLKEFVQSVHIDLLAGLFFLMFLLKLKENKHYQSLSFLAAQILTKLLGLLVYPLMIIKNKNNIFRTSLFTLIPLVLYLGLAFNESSNGPSEFIKSWKWNSLVYEILLDFGIEHKIIKYILRILFGISYLSIIMSYYKRKISFHSSLVLLFSSLFFFSHVYNPWYGIYLFIPAYFIGNLGFVLYSLAGFLGYLLYDYNFEFTIAFMTHLFFFIGCYELFNNKDKVNIRS